MTAGLRASRRRVLAASAAGAVLVAATVTAGLLLMRQGPDREDPAAVADTWATAYATGDSQACELATEQFAADLQAGGRCGTNTTGDASPQVTVLFAKPCTTRALAGIAAPVDTLGTPYALLGMERREGQWAVDSVTPLSERQAVQPGRCDTEGAA